VGKEKQADAAHLRDEVQPALGARKADLGSNPSAWPSIEIVCAPIEVVSPLVW